ncbi:hypothetical protein L873DRAFT_956497 [Choiromyces venosus 120613-1]|uniref:Uncharacterized protein n=1 Tax=Choiromyces venosus 120613-1 TaxID=1336337 RepID=A0A3N4K4D3_9PEZI|nr:hypothetical protein L873DRAFT_956497 [Choiromyces venosus 120613-1]
MNYLAHQSVCQSIGSPIQSNQIKSSPFQSCRNRAAEEARRKEKKRKKRTPASFLPSFLPSLLLSFLPPPSFLFFLFFSPSPFPNLRNNHLFNHPVRYDVKIKIPHYYYYFPPKKPTKSSCSPHLQQKPCISAVL